MVGCARACAGACACACAYVCSALRMVAPALTLSHPHPWVLGVCRRDETFDNILKNPLQFPAKPQVCVWGGGGRWVCGCCMRNVRLSEQR